VYAQTAVLPKSESASAAVDEKARVVELNSKLHELCRELRKENALLLDTSKAISAQELSQRKSLTENFQETVEGITRRYRCAACVSSLQTASVHIDKLC